MALLAGTYEAETRVDPIRLNLTKYRDFSKNLVQKSLFLTNDDLFGPDDVNKKTKKTPLRGNCDNIAQAGDQEKPSNNHIQ